MIFLLILFGEGILLKFWSIFKCCGILFINCWGIVFVCGIGFELFLSWCWICVVREFNYWVNLLLDFVVLFWVVVVGFIGFWVVVFIWDGFMFWKRRLEFGVCGVVWFDGVFWGVICFGVCFVVRCCCWRVICCSYCWKNVWLGIFGCCVWGFCCWLIFNICWVGGVNWFFWIWLRLGCGWLLDCEGEIFLRIFWMGIVIWFIYWLILVCIVGVMGGIEGLLFVGFVWLVCIVILGIVFCWFVVGLKNGNGIMVCKCGGKCCKFGVLFFCGVFCVVVFGVFGVGLGVGVLRLFSFVCCNRNIGSRGWILFIVCCCWFDDCVLLFCLLLFCEFCCMICVNGEFVWVWRGGRNGVCGGLFGWLLLGCWFWDWDLIWFSVWKSKWIFWCVCFLDWVLCVGVGVFVGLVGVGVIGGFIGIFFWDFLFLFDFGLVLLIMFFLKGLSGKRICVFCWFLIGWILEGGFLEGLVDLDFFLVWVWDFVDGDWFCNDLDCWCVGGFICVFCIFCCLVCIICCLFGVKKGEFGLGEDWLLGVDCGEVGLFVFCLVFFVEVGGELLFFFWLLVLVMERSILFFFNFFWGGFKLV